MVFNPTWDKAKYIKGISFIMNFGEANLFKFLLKQSDNYNVKPMYNKRMFSWYSMPIYYSMFMNSPVINCVPLQQGIIYPEEVILSSVGSLHSPEVGVSFGNYSKQEAVKMGVFILVCKYLKDKHE